MPCAYQLFTLLIDRIHNTFELYTNLGHSPRGPKGHGTARPGGGGKSTCTTWGAQDKATRPEEGWACASLGSPGPPVALHGIESNSPMESLRNPWASQAHLAGTVPRTSSVPLFDQIWKPLRPLAWDSMAHQNRGFVPGWLGCLKLPRCSESSCRDVHVLRSRCF